MLALSACIAFILLSSVALLTQRMPLCRDGKQSLELIHAAPICFDWNTIELMACWPYGYVLLLPY